ncbi:MAG TPA: hypothetical protein VGB84_05530, partial [Arachidicoccus sp.]
VLDTSGVLAPAGSFPNTKAMHFVAWFTNSNENIDGKSKSKEEERLKIYFQLNRLVFHFYQTAIQYLTINLTRIVTKNIYLYSKITIKRFGYLE